MTKPNGTEREFHLNDLKDLERKEKAAALIAEAVERMSEEDNRLQILAIFEQIRMELYEFYQGSTHLDRDFSILCQILARTLQQRADELPKGNSVQEKIIYVRWDDEEKLELTQLKDKVLAGLAERILSEVVFLMNNGSLTAEQVGNIYKFAEGRLKQVYGEEDNEDLTRLLLILGRRVIKANRQKS